MLYMLGPVMFEIYPLNPQTIERDAEASLIDKQVVGRRPPLEFTGPGPETIRFSAKLFPEKFGGLSSLDDLNSMRLSGIAQYLMRGDGTPLGFYSIQRVTEKSSYIGPSGVGRQIDVEITLKRDDAPALADAFLSIFGDIA